MWRSSPSNTVTVSSVPPAVTVATVSWTVTERFGRVVPHTEKLPDGQRVEGSRVGSPSVTRVRCDRDRMAGPCPIDSDDDVAVAERLSRWRRRPCQIQSVKPEERKVPLVSEEVRAPLPVKRSRRVTVS